MYMQQYNETVRGGKMDLVFFKVTSSAKYPLMISIDRGTPLVRRFSFVSGVWAFWRGGLSSGVEIDHFMVTFTLNSGLP